MEKTYIVNNAFFNKDKKVRMSEKEFHKWMLVNANAHYGYYRVVGDDKSNHYFVDFEEMWEITVEEK